MKVRIVTAHSRRNVDGVVRVDRDEIVVASKLPGRFHRYDAAVAAIEESVLRTGLDHIDLYLIHWPVAGKYKEAWRALETLYKEGRVKAIGVSNFQVHHLQDLIKDAEIKPMINQVESHPRLTQKELKSFCKEYNIQVVAWAPLMQGQLLSNEALQQIANKYEKSVAQIILRWHLQNGVITIPKSTKAHRIVENADVFDFQLTKVDMEYIDGLNQNHRVGPDPDNFDF